ncbi:MAG TPA: hypothetical protein EYP54_02205, partial [Anaerolineales bacterium]|nr:hypothetical protein [Anaerolineales bacterium]
MPRRDPFARLKRPQSPTPTEGGASPPRPIDLIPRPRKRTRRRDWERANPTHSYKIPAELHARARTVREALVGLAQRYQTTADDVARALMTAALAAVREGVIKLDYLPNPQGVPGEGPRLWRPAGRHVIYWDDKGLWSYDEPWLISFEEVQGLGRALDAEQPDLFESSVNQGRSEDLAVFCYTSGTTGLPKGAMISHGNLIAGCDQTMKVDPRLET